MRQISTFYILLFPFTGNCPPNFVKIDGIRRKCYHISALQQENDNNKNTLLYDWKTGHSQCNKMGGRLVEMVAYEDFVRISQFLVKYAESNKK